MKAVVYEEYGSPNGLRLVDVATPTPTADQILIKTRAVSINGSDKENLSGRPLYTRMSGLRRPSNPILGSDIAGRVAFVGQNNTEFQVGDEVFGEIPGYHGGFAEYVCTQGKTLLHKPADLTFEQAAAIPQGGVIALQGIREKGQVQAGHKVLINGAGGSAGVFAIQLARLVGAEVTGVDNAYKLDFMRSLGADHVIDYKQEDYAKSGRQYDLILDLIAQRPLFASQHALRPNGTYIVVGGYVSVLLQALLLGPLIRKVTGKNMRLLTVSQNRKDLKEISELCLAGDVVPVIDKVYALRDVPEAMRYVAEGRAKGKVVINIG